MKLAPLLPFLIAAPAAAQIRLTEVHTVDLSATAVPAGGHYIGSHPAVIAWRSATSLRVAGTNAGGASGVGILEVDVQSSSPFYGPVFHFVAGTPDGFGYTGLHYDYAAYDAGVEHPEGLQAFAGNQLAWAQTARGSSGLAVQNNLSVPPLGIAWLTLGSERRALASASNGAPIYTHADGMVVNPGGSNAWRDLCVDSATMDYYARRGNDVVKVVRTGENSGTPSVLVDLVDADSVPGQHVEFMPVSLARLVVYNDRTSAAPGQSFFDVVRFATDAGAPVSVDWGTFAPPTGNGQYDFAFTNNVDYRLAVLDVANRRLTIFHVDLQPNTVPFCSGDGTATACPCGNSGAPGRGCANSTDANGALLSTSGLASASADSLVLHGSGMPDSAALYFQGTNSPAMGAGVVFGDGLRCVGGQVYRLKTVTNVGGASQYPEPGDPAITTFPWAGYYTTAYQVWYRNAASYCTSATFNLTNGVVVWWGA